MSRWSGIHSLVIRLVTRAECIQPVLYTQNSGWECNTDYPIFRVDPFSAGTDFRRQNLTSIDVRI